MSRLTLVALMAAIVAIIRACTISPLDMDQGGHVSYEGTVESFTFEAPPNEKKVAVRSTSITIEGCVRASITRDASHFKVSVRICDGKSFDYERELMEALVELETNRFEISPKQQGLVKFSECLSTGGLITLNLAVERQCSETKVCRVVANGRKELAIHQFGLMKPFDAWDLLPNKDNAGCLIGGQASVVIMGLFMYVSQVIIHSFSTL